MIGAIGNSRSLAYHASRFMIKVDLGASAEPEPELEGETEPEPAHLSQKQGAEKCTGGTCVACRPTVVAGGSCNQKPGTLASSADTPKAPAGTASKQVTVTGASLRLLLSHGSHVPPPPPLPWLTCPSPSSSSMAHTSNQ